MVTGRDDSHRHIDGLTEKYGIVGVALGGRDATRPLYYSLYALQHRGQESAGIVTHDEFQQHSHVQMGLVGDAFGADDLGGLKGEVGIGHIHYPAAGDTSKSCAQPLAVSLKSESPNLTRNGSLANADELRDELENSGHAFTSTDDTEVIAHDPMRNLLEGGLVRAVKRTMERIHDSYALTIMHDETILGVHDPEGNRPLCIGKIDDGYVLASESATIDTLNGELVHDVKSGELVVLEPDGSSFGLYRLVERDNTAHCFFEHTYFARPDSMMSDTLVYEARRGLGRKLWDENSVDTGVIMPIPDSGHAFASGYAEAAQKDDATAEFAGGLMKNRYVGWMFIIPAQDERERAACLKLNLIKSTVEGESVTLINDSVVHGATPNRLVQLLYDAGTTEVHMHIGTSSIVALCYVGINMTAREELIASDELIEEVCNTIGTDSLGYLSIDSVAEVLERSQNDLCLDCVTGEYPYDIGGEETNRDVSRPVAGAEAPLSD